MIVSLHSSLGNRARFCLKKKEKAKEKKIDVVWMCVPPDLMLRCEARCLKWSLVKVMGADPS